MLQSGSLRNIDVSIKIRDFSLTTKKIGIFEVTESFHTSYFGDVVDYKPSLFHKNNSYQNFDETMHPIV